jgi:sporulation protein YlmC with PRC-barrel domain
MRIDELLGMPIVTVHEGMRLGRADGVEIDPAEGRVAYLKFKGDDRPDGLIPWSSIRAIGKDAVTVESVMTALDSVSQNDRIRLTPHVGDRPVVTESGHRLGHITGYDIDPSDGRIVSYRISAGLFHRDLEFRPTAIRTFGTDAVIVDDAVIPAKAA